MNATQSIRDIMKKKPRKIVSQTSHTTNQYPEIVPSEIMQLKRITASVSPVEKRDDGITLAQLKSSKRPRSSLRAIFKNASKSIVNLAPSVEDTARDLDLDLSVDLREKKMLSHSNSTLSSASSMSSLSCDIVEEVQVDPIKSLLGNRKRRIHQTCDSGAAQIQIGAIVGQSTMTRKQKCTASTEPVVVTKSERSSDQANDLLATMTEAANKRKKSSAVKDVMRWTRKVLRPFRGLYVKEEIVEFKRAKGRLV